MDECWKLWRSEGTATIEGPEIPVGTEIEVVPAAEAERYKEERDEAQVEAKFWRGQSQAAKSFADRVQARADDATRPEPPPLNDRDEMWKVALSRAEAERDGARLEVDALKHALRKAEGDPPVNERIPEEAKRAAYEAHQHYQALDPREMSEDGWMEAILAAALPALKENWEHDQAAELQRLRKALRVEVKRLRREADERDMSGHPTDQEAADILSDDANHLEALLQENKREDGGLGGE